MARESIEQKVAALGDLSRPELMDLWVKLYGFPPPLGIRQPLLLRAAACDLQERHMGGLSANAKRLLKSAVNRVAGKAGATKGAAEIEIPGNDPVGARQLEVDCPPIGTAAASAGRPDTYRSIPSPGARLIREWNGRRYVVEVIEGGFMMDGKHYRSLTAIAFRITGAKWSGPRFFGL
jgi:hypothetical protein